MPRECPVCGARITALEARFCRRCGAPLKATDAAAATNTDAVVSPVAPTAPLMDEGRATSGLAAEESQRLHDHTSRIKRAEMEELLRRVAREHDSEAADPLPLTSADEPAQTLAASTTATASTAEPSSTTEPAATDAPRADGQISNNSSAPPVQLSPPRRLVSRRVLTLVLLGVALVVVTLALIALRRSKASSTVGPTAPPAAEGAQPVAQSQEQEPGTAQIEPVALASPLPAATPRPTPSVRARETGTATGQTGAQTATQAPTVPGTAPSPEAPAAQQAATETTPSVSPTEHYQRGIQLWTTDRRAALEEFRAAVPAVPDAYYYLGSEYYSEGRDLKSLSDGELRAALNYFTRVTSGPHSGQASRYVQALGKEYDRRKRQARP